MKNIQSLLNDTSIFGKTGKEDIINDLTKQSIQYYKAKGYSDDWIKKNYQSDEQTVLKNIIQDNIAGISTGTKFEINNVSKPKPDDDINVSVDQTQNLINAINNGIEYPQLLNGRVQYEDLVDFLLKLRNIFKWNIYCSHLNH